MSSKEPNILELILEQNPDLHFWKADGFDDAVIGVDLGTSRLVYSVSACLLILAKTMTNEEAVEYFDYNVGGAYVGDKTPIWCYDVF